MNTDQKLRQLLTDAAHTYQPARSGDDARKRHWVRGVAIAAGLVVVLVALGLLITNFGGRDSAESSSSGASAGVAQQPAASTAGDAATSESAKSTSSQPQAAAGGAGRTEVDTVAAQPARVVQTGQLGLEVARGKVGPTLDRLSAIAAGAGGFVSQSRADDVTSSPSGTTTLRVPVASFSGVTNQVRKLGTVTSATTTARDVTAQYVDLTARISALSQTRNAFYTLLSKADTIGDTLAVQQQITTVQTQLEQLQGQQKVLGDSSDLATLSVSVTQQGTPVVDTKKPDENGFAKAWNRSVHAFNTGVQAVITVLGPLLLVVLLLLTLTGLGLLGRRLYRRYTRPVTQ